MVFCALLQVEPQASLPNHIQSSTAVTPIHPNINKEIDQTEIECLDVHATTTAHAEASRAGIGGWLALLILGLVLLGPFFGAVRIGGDIASTESQYPGLLTVPAWATYKSAIWFSYLLGTGLGIYAGVCLFSKRDASVVSKAKIIIWIIGPAAAVVNSFVIPLAIFGKLESDPRIFGALLGSILFTTLWTAYLSKSRRIKARYG